MTLLERTPRSDLKPTGLKIAIVGSGISGLSAAWLLSQKHDVTVYEAADRLGGHSFTVSAPTANGHLPVDMGFIVYNAQTYPNLVALFDNLSVPTLETNMGFSVSLDDGRVEYGGDNLVALFSQARNLVSPRFWSMLRDLVRFYRQAPGHAAALEAEDLSLGEYLDRFGYGDAFQHDHILPQAAAIWSASTEDIRDYPLQALIRFFENHGLLKILGRPTWRTVEGGSRAYVEKLTSQLRGPVCIGRPVTRVKRVPNAVLVTDAGGNSEVYDHVIMATHADDGLALVADVESEERRLLGAFSYSWNRTVLHSDQALMPQRRRTWSAWNYMGHTQTGAAQDLCVTYWMNRLQHLPTDQQYFVTLNPIKDPDPASVVHSEVFTHPIFNAAALQAQKQLWSLQGAGGLWWCGAYFGSGFHEDGLQSGLAVAEAIGGSKRPWQVPHESSRISLGPLPWRVNPLDHMTSAR